MDMFKNESGGSKRKLLRTSSRQNLLNKKKKAYYFPQIGQTQRPSTAAVFSHRSKRKLSNNTEDVRSTLVGSITPTKHSFERHNDYEKQIRPATASTIIEARQKRKNNLWSQGPVPQSSGRGGETFNAKQEERKRTRAVIYATNNIMKTAFQKQFDQHMKRKGAEAGKK